VHQVFTAEPSVLRKNLFLRMDKKKELIIHADDLGMSKGVNTGIFGLYDAGVVTSTSLMVGMPAAEEAASGLRERPEMCAGLHVSFCQGRKISRSAILESISSDNGTFRGYGSFLTSYTAGFLPRADLENEIRCQMNEFTRLTGRSPTHFDSHRYIHALPGIMKILISVAEETGGTAIRNPMETVPGRSPRPRPPASKIEAANPAGGSRVRPGRRAGRLRLRQKAASILLRSFSNKAFELLRRSGLPTTEAFYGVRQMNAGAFEEAFKHVVACLEPGVSELMCHPAEPDEPLELLTWYAEARGLELKALSGAEFRRALDENDVKLTSFSELLPG